MPGDVQKWSRVPKLANGGEVFPTERVEESHLTVSPADGEADSFTLIDKLGGGTVGEIL